MKEIICPKCEEAFKIDEAGYAEIIKQVRNDEFDAEITKREASFVKEKESAISLAKSSIINEYNSKLNEKDQYISSLEATKNKEFLMLQSTKDLEISNLTAKINSFEQDKALAILESIKNIEKERDKLSSELESEKKLKELQIQSIESSYREQIQSMIKQKDIQLKDKDDLIERYKDMKAKLSTKMLGETLEQHCEMEFNKLRPTAFQNTYFKKDSDASGGTKGDYIFREEDSEGNEIISIMFEMKNEGDETSKKQKIESFLKKLDEDRNKKKCEYAVLVTLLEADSDFYNNGIVDVSYLYPKMYVIRPQFFIPMITLLRNAAMNTITYKSELARLKNQNIDVTKFESRINDFKKNFGYNREQAVKKFEAAIKGIDESITHLTSVKENLLGTINQMRLASDKLDELTIKKLTYNNPTMKQKFDELGQ
jgi:hypothetical protein